MTTTKELKDTYKYHLKNEANRTIYRDVTNDLERREREHQVRYPGSHIVQIGRRTTRAQALKWAKAGGKAGPSRAHKNDKQATRADLKAEVERLTKGVEGIIAQMEKAIAERDAKAPCSSCNGLGTDDGEVSCRDCGGSGRKPVLLTTIKLGQSGSPWWLYTWHTMSSGEKHTANCSIDRFVDPNGRYFDHWNCRR